MLRMVSSAPSGLASTTKAEPLALEANHLNPLSRHPSPSGVAVVSSAARSEPPVRSVSICAASPAYSPGGEQLADARLDVVGRELLGEAHDHVAAGAEGAHHADLGLVEQVGPRRLQRAGVDAGPRAPPP